MGILDFLTGEFIDVIHWVDDTQDTLVWRFEREGHEIKYGAKLTVREGLRMCFIPAFTCLKPTTCRSPHR